MTGTLTDALDQEHVLACVLARQREQLRCTRIVGRWAQFVQTHATDDEKRLILLAVLGKVAREIEEGSDPPFASWEPPTDRRHLTGRHKDGGPA